MTTPSTASFIYNQYGPALAATAIAALPAITGRVPALASPIHTLAIGVAALFFERVASRFCPSSLKREQLAFGYCVARAVVWPIALYRIGLPATAGAALALQLGGLAKLAVDLVQMALESRKAPLIKS